jgi:hypothetical protein
MGDKDVCHPPVSVGGSIMKRGIAHIAPSVWVDARSKKQSYGLTIAAKGCYVDQAVSSRFLVGQRINGRDRIITFIVDQISEAPL